MEENYYTSLMITIPKFEAHMCITDDLMISVRKKPNWFHRLMQKLILGIIYKDIV